MAVGPGSAGAAQPDDPLLRALAEYWPDVLELATAEQRATLIRLVAGGADADPIDTREELADLLVDLLPADHPLVEVLRTSTMFGTGTDRVADVARDLGLLRDRVLPAPGSGEPVVPPSSTGEPPTGSTGLPPEPRGAYQSADPSSRPTGPVSGGGFGQGFAGGFDGDGGLEFDREVQARLLGLPALSPDEVRDRGVDPADARLIRLLRPDRDVQLPAFQFAAAGQPWPVVREVNALLDAAADPWGVTCWWVDPHSWLDTSPAELLGRGQDPVLVRAAEAVGED